MFPDAKPCHDMPVTSPSNGYDSIMKSMCKAISNCFLKKISFGYCIHNKWNH